MECSCQIQLPIKVKSQILTWISARIYHALHVRIFQRLCILEILFLMKCQFNVLMKDFLVSSFLCFPYGFNICSIYVMQLSVIAQHATIMLLSYILIWTKKRKKSYLMSLASKFFGRCCLFPVFPVLLILQYLLQTIAGNILVGSYCAFSNQGGIVHPHTKIEDLDELSALLQVKQPLEKKGLLDVKCFLHRSPLWQEQLIEAVT